MNNLLRHLLFLGSFIAICFSFVSCGDSAPKSIQQTIALPKVELPTLPPINDERDQANWMTAHFWDKMNPTDTAWKVHKGELTNVINAWSVVMQRASFGSMRDGINAVFEKSKSDSTAVALLFNEMEQAFYSPYLEVRNFEAYIAALEWVVNYDGFSDVDKMRPRAQLEMSLKNRVGTKALNFNFMTLDNNKYKLHDVYGPYTLIFLNTPGCPSCKDYKEILMNNRVVENMVNIKALQIIGVVVDDEESQWREKASEFPKEWINGWNYDMGIRKDRSYDLTVIPSLILLDKDKNVIMKDVNPNMLVDFLMRI